MSIPASHSYAHDPEHKPSSIDRIYRDMQQHNFSRVPQNCARLVHSIHRQREVIANTVLVALPSHDAVTTVRYRMF